MSAEEPCCFSTNTWHLSLSRACQGCSSEANCGGRPEKLCTEFPRTLRSWLRVCAWCMEYKRLITSLPLTAGRLPLPVSIQQAWQGRFPCIPACLI